MKYDWRKLKVNSDFKCDRDIYYPSRYNCNNCNFFYEVREEGFSHPKCLKQDVRDWTKYRIDKEKNLNLTEQLKE